MLWGPGRGRTFAAVRELVGESDPGRPASSESTSSAAWSSGCSWSPSSSCGGSAAPRSSGPPSTAQIMVIAMYSCINISYLWYNFSGCLACVLFSPPSSRPPSVARRLASLTRSPQDELLSHHLLRPAAVQGFFPKAAHSSPRFGQRGGSSPRSAARSCSSATTATTTSARPGRRSITIARRASRSSSTLAFASQINESSRRSTSSESCPSGVPGPCTSCGPTWIGPGWSRSSATAATNIADFCAWRCTTHRMRPAGRYPGGTIERPGLPPRGLRHRR